MWNLFFSLASRQMPLPRQLRSTRHSGQRSVLRATPRSHSAQNYFFYRPSRLPCTSFQNPQTFAAAAVCHSGYSHLFLPAFKAAVCQPSKEKQRQETANGRSKWLNISQHEKGIGGTSALAHSISRILS